jgi:hypothetical protein
MAKKTGNKKSMVAKKTTSKSAPAKSTPAKSTPAKKVAASTKSKQTGGAKTVAQKATPAKKPVTKKAASAKKAPAKTTAKAAAKAAATPAQEGGVTKTKVTRSFKVQLPGSEEYSGRFTGSTPYQAANKALSKYFRVTEKPKSVVTFSIRESTRGSKHNVYTYEGHRVKLETPVTYTIGEGNTITKHHKNQLKKVKKADLAESKKEAL